MTCLTSEKDIIPYEKSTLTKILADSIGSWFYIVHGLTSWCIALRKWIAKKKTQVNFSLNVPWPYNNTNWSIVFLKILASSHNYSKNWI